VRGARARGGSDADRARPVRPLLRATVHGWLAAACLPSRGRFFFLPRFFKEGSLRSPPVATKRARRRRPPRLRLRVRGSRPGLSTEGSGRPCRPRPTRQASRCPPLGHQRAYRRRHLIPSDTEDKRESSGVLFTSFFFSHGEQPPPAGPGRYRRLLFASQDQDRGWHDDACCCSPEEHAAFSEV
jgi:hypothetical protein